MTPDRTKEPAVDGGLLRACARLSYEGTDFSGWARQPGRRTVQQVLEDALSVVLRIPPVRTVCAGRTDAGVHARDQHVHLDVPAEAWRAAPNALIMRRLNGVLPPDVRVLSLGEAPPGFDARFSVRSRQYRYRISDLGPADPLLRRFTLEWDRPLDLGPLNEAGQSLLGEHDFAALCRHREGASTVRTILTLSWERDANAQAVMTVRADAFCHSMVRSLVGLLLPVGDGRRGIDWPGEMVAARHRDPRIVVVPARGLVLDEVDYAADPAAQAVLARRRRG